MEKDFEFIKGAGRDLKDKSLWEYLREAIQAKIKGDGKKRKALKQNDAMTPIGRVRYENLFEGLAGEDFAVRGTIPGQP